MDSHPQTYDTATPKRLPQKYQSHLASGHISVQQFSQDLQHLSWILDALKKTSSLSDFQIYHDMYSMIYIIWYLFLLECWNIRNLSNFQAVNGQFSYPFSKLYSVYVCWKCLPPCCLFRHWRTCDADIWKDHSEATKLPCTMEDWISQESWRFMEIHGVSVHRKSPNNADRKFETSNTKKT